LFGGGDKPKDDETKIPEGKMYPPLTQEEIEDCLAHIPVFAVTDSNGAGLVLKPDNETSVFYFFLSPQMANDTLTSLQSEMTEGMDLRVSAFSLGKIAFKILDASGQGVDMKLKKPNSDQVETESSVEYRLVPDTRLVTLNITASPFLLMCSFSSMFSYDIIILQRSSRSTYASYYGR